MVSALEKGSIQYLNDHLNSKCHIKITAIRLILICSNGNNITRAPIKTV